MKEQMAVVLTLMYAAIVTIAFFAVAVRWQNDEKRSHNIVRQHERFEQKLVYQPEEYFYVGEDGRLYATEGVQIQQYNMDGLDGAREGGLSFEGYRYHYQKVAERKTYEDIDPGFSFPE